MLFISHDETLIERTANMVIHIEQIIRKTKARYTVAKLPYRRYVEERLHKFEIQKQIGEISTSAKGWTINIKAMDA